ncbi:hypothetical protein [Hyalangium sp.]|uniref:hypothetical protein n=1 Tax=Hyalangium sp. TaxID=2028555 RepID=UPI00389AD8E5
MAPPFLLTAVLVLVSSGSLWGVSTARQDAADQSRMEERAQMQSTAAQLAALQVRLATVETDAAGTRRLIDTELAGLRREMERIAKAVERMSDAQPMRTTRRGD